MKNQITRVYSQSYQSLCCPHEKKNAYVGIKNAPSDDSCGFAEAQTDLSKAQRRLPEPSPRHKKGMCSDVAAQE